MIDRRGAMGQQPLGLRQVMDRLLEDAVVAPRQGGGASWGGPALDVYEEADNFVVEAQLPGLQPDNIDVHVERGILTISGRTMAEPEPQGRNYLLREQHTGNFSRSLQLPATYTAEPSAATYEQGILRLVFPKSEQAKPRRIQVTTGASQPSATAGQRARETTGVGTAG
jgi:HSP20 family protein